MADQSINVPEYTINTGSGFVEVLAGLPNVDTGFDADTNLYLAQLSPVPSMAFQVAVNALIVAMKADGNWYQLDRFWIHATEYQQNARISLKNPSSTAITEVAAPAWVANQGYTGNGTTQYLDTNYNTTTSSVFFTQNSGSIGVYIRTNVNEDRDDIGNLSASTANIVRSRRTANTQTGALNQASAILVARTDSRGLSTAARTGAAAMAIYKNGVSVATGVNASTALPNLNIYVMALNSTGSAANFTTKQTAMSFIGSGSINQLSLYNSFQTFATTRGFNV